MSSAINYFKAKRSDVKEWFNSKGYSGTLHDSATGYFQNKSGLGAGTLYDHMDKTLSDLGYAGTLRDKLDTFFIAEKGGVYPVDAERAFFADQSADFGGGGEALQGVGGETLQGVGGETLELS